MKKVIIAPSSYHEFLLKNLREKDPFNNDKIYTKEGLIRDFFGSFDKAFIIRLIKEKHITYELAKNLVFYMPFITIENNDKQKYILSLKNQFESGKYFAKNEFLNVALKDSIALIYGYGKDDPLLNFVLDSLKVKRKYICDIKELEMTITSFNMIEDEVFYVLNEISSLIKSGVSPTDIYLFNASNEKYQYYLSLFSPSFGLKINGLETNNLFLSGFCTEFFQKYTKDVSPIVAIEEMKEKYEDDEIFTLLYELVTAYFDEELPYANQKDIYISLAKEKNIKGPSYKNAITIINNPIPVQDKYIFVLAFDSNIPHVNVDKDFLMDEEKKGTLLETSVIKNRNERDVLLEFLSSDNEFYYSYTSRIDGKVNYPSPLVKNPSLQIVESTLPNTFYSLFYAQSVLNQSLDLDYYYKEKSEGLNLKEILATSYRSYNNEFKGVEDKIKDFINLSYSSVTKYYECPFNYYLSYILGLDNFEERFSTTYGSFAHEVLEDIYKKDYDFEHVYHNKYEQYKDKFNYRDRVLLENLNLQLLKAATVLRKHYFEYIDNPSYEVEQKIETRIDEKTYLNGRFDKVIKTPEYYMVVDYKTYSSSFSSEFLNDGIGLQLPIYAVLLDTYKPVSGLKAAGFYINVILDKSIKEAYADKGEACPSYLKLNGITIFDDVDITKIDKSLEGGEKSIFIEGLKLNASSKKVVSRNEFDSFKETALIKIKEAAEKIRENEYPISPYFIDTKYKNGCAYCDNRDICFVKEIQKRFIKEGGDED